MRYLTPTRKLLLTRKYVIFSLQKLSSGSERQRRKLANQFDGLPCDVLCHVFTNILQKDDDPDIKYVSNAPHVAWVGISGC
jgi:hypothetical protein